MTGTTLKSLIILLLAIALGSWAMHEFYVSLTEVRYNSRSGRVEVSIRVFPDDLDRALLEKHGIHTQLASELEAPEADSLLKVYLLDHFSLEINGQFLELEYLGKEPEADAIWCYLESETVSEPKSYRIHNSILTMSFEDQVNIVQVYQGEWNRGLMFNRDQHNGQLSVGK
ncbi:MAG: DUF6702 family protein [Bacteroidota bacterium]